MIDLLSPVVRLILVDIRPKCDIWVKTLSAKELAGKPADNPRFISFGVLKEMIHPAQDKDYLPVHYWFRSNNTILMINTQKDKNGHLFLTPPVEFRIVLPEGCELSFHFV